MAINVDVLGGIDSDEQEAEHFREVKDFLLDRIRRAGEEAVSIEAIRAALLEHLLPD